MALFQPFKAKRLTLALLTAMAVQGSHAITLQPIEVLSSPDELLYAEIRFTGADTSQNMSVSAASAEDLASLGISEPVSADNLNFYSRSNNYGDGVITITSNKPLSAKELNVVIKINQGNATRLQHVRTPLKATLTKEQIANNERNLIPTVVSEKDLNLNLPEATGATTTTTAEAQPTKTKTTQPVVSVAQAKPAENKPTTAQAQPVAKPAENKPTTAQAQPVAKPTENKPTMAQAQPVAKPTENKPTTAQAQPVATPAENKPTTAQTQPSVAKNSSQEMLAKSSVALGGSPTYQSEFLVIQRTITLPNGEKIVRNTLSDKSSPTTATTPEENKQPTQHTVQKNESLWSIAQSISAQTSQPIGQVMEQIKQNNPDAFVKGNASLLRQGAVLNVIVAPNTSTEKTPTSETANTQKAPNKPKPTQAKATKVPAKTAPKPAPSTQTKSQNQARLSLVAESKQDSAYGSSKVGNGNNKASANLNSKVMQAREKAVNSQKDVSNLTSSLKAKDQKLKILNARLAQLEQQLQAKPNKNAQ